MADRLRVAHVLTNLTVGGAQVMASRLVTKRAPDIDALVISLQSDAPLAPQFEAVGANVTVIGLDQVSHLPSCFFRLRAALRDYRPAVVQTWLYHADLLGGLAAGRIPVVWNLRQTAVRSASMPRTTRLAARAGALLSGRVPEAIVCCSDAACAAHAEFGYVSSKMITIENGIDTEVFRTIPDARPVLCNELGLSLASPLVVHVGRLDPEKDHATFLRAFAFVRARVPGVHALLVGDGLTPERLPPSLRSLPLDGVHLLGRRNDVAALLSAADVAVSSSRSEGFPNAVGEAMACGTPCVVTDVGGSAELVGDTAVRVPPGSPAELADAIASVLALPHEARAALGEQARNRILHNFDIGDIARRYENLYRAVARGEGPDARAV